MVALSLRLVSESEERVMQATEVGPVNDLDNRLRAVERITLLFKPERFVYLCLAIAAFIMLIACFICTLVRNEQQLVASLGAFGSSGVVAFTSSRVLLMW